MHLHRAQLSPASRNRSDSDRPADTVGWTEFPFCKQATHQMWAAPGFLTVKSRIVPKESACICFADVTNLSHNVGTQISWRYALPRSRESLTPGPLDTASRIEHSADDHIIGFRIALRPSEELHRPGDGGSGG